ncbi:MAG: MBL fold metallo-hydrolase [Deltaproteobacteria bacterium]|nr:MBL fold metallo-hydrolase [Deltaproteobacteria bacterium]
MKIRFWGVRGSIPVPGTHTNRYGGNTSCVEVRPRSGPQIIIDAGTGIRKLGKEMMQADFGHGNGICHLLISHTHWDHIQGLPFFAPLYQAGNQFYVYARQRDDTHLRAVFASQSEDPYFPVPFNSVKANLAFRELVEGARFEIGPVKVGCTRLNHPWIAMAYRLDCDGASMVYSTDTAPFTDILLEHEFIATPPVLGAPLVPEHAEKLRRMRDGLIQLSQGADMLIYDTQFTPEEYRSKPHWGHSTPYDAIDIALAAKVKTLVLFHHAPERTDDELDEVLAEVRSLTRSTGLEIVAAHEQLEVSLGAN